MDHITLPLHLYSLESTGRMTDVAATLLDLMWLYAVYVPVWKKSFGTRLLFADSSHQINSFPGAVLAIRVYFTELNDRLVAGASWIQRRPCLHSLEFR